LDWAAAVVVVLNFLKVAGWWSLYTGGRGRGKGSEEVRQGEGWQGQAVDSPQGRQWRNHPVLVAVAASLVQDLPI
jgi:hypothetical protein